MHFSQHLIFSVDESIESASGCSIDSSVRLMKQLGSELQVDFFNRSFVLVSKETESKRVHIQKLNQFLDWKTRNPLAINLEEVRTSSWIDLKDHLRRYHQIRVPQNHHRRKTHLLRL